MNEELQLENLEDYINLDQDMVNECLRDACGSGDMELIEFLLTSDEMKNNGQLDYESSWPLKHACFNHQYDVILFVIQLESLKENNKNYTIPLGLFKNICVASNTRNDPICDKIINYLIVEKSYDVDEETCEMLKNIGAEKIIQLIENNKLHYKLNESLVTSDKKEIAKKKI